MALLSEFRHHIKKSFLGAMISAHIRHRRITKQFPGTLISPLSILDNPELISIGEGSEINEYVIIRTWQTRISIGKNVQINPFTVIYGGSLIDIGENSMIGPHCMLVSGNHDYIQTAKPMRFSGTITKGPIIIKENVWIGSHCTVTDGVTIGAGAVVAANSVVTKDVPPDEVVAGAPARRIFSRVSPSIKSRNSLNA